MKEHKGIIEINKALFDVLEWYLQKGKMFGDAGEDEVIQCFTAVFPNGYEADIKVCNASEEGGGAWVDQVLFDPNGCEACIADVSDTLKGSVRFEHGGDSYIVETRVV